MLGRNAHVGPTHWMNIMNNLRQITFRKQMAQAMAELHDVMSSGKSPTANGVLNIRDVEVTKLRNHDTGKTVKSRMALSRQSLPTSKSSASRKSK
jgi:hypothetical protein